MEKKIVSMTKGESTGEYWERRYTEGGTSGVGSEGDCAKFKAQVLNKFFKANSIHSIIDFGCGDGRQIIPLSDIYILGLDISPTAIEICKKGLADRTKCRFEVYEPNLAPYYRAQAVISLDVIYHLLEKDTYEAYMTHLFEMAKDWVVIYAEDGNTTKKARALHVKPHNFTKWIYENQPEWQLDCRIPNEYPELSNSDFYIYKRKES